MRTRQSIQAAILVLLGLLFLDMLASGEIAYYINERFNWLAGLGGALFLMFGAISAFRLLWQPAHEAEQAHDHEHDHDYTHDHDHDHGHDHAHGQAVSWPVLAILSLPLVLMIALPAKPLGAAAIGSSASVVTSLSTNSSPQQYQIAPAERNVLDWVRAFSASTEPDEFAGQPANLIGFVYRDARFDESSQLMVTRFTVSCCVADAVAIGVIVVAPDAAEWQQDSWLHVRGTFQVQEFDGHRTPVLVAESIEAATMPDQPYLFP